MSVHSKRLYFDIESDGFLDQATRIHCISTQDIDTGETKSFFGDSIESGIKFLKSAARISGHNVIDFDIPLIKNLYPHLAFTDDEMKRVDDTLIISRLFFPDLMTSQDYKDLYKEYNKVARKNGLPNKKPGGPHSIEAWGFRFGTYKIEHEDWTIFSDAMLHRCEVDVEIGVKLYKKLEQLREQWPWEKCIEIEHKIAHQMQIQASNGCLFDMDKALTLLSKIDREMTEIKVDITEILPYNIIQEGEVSKIFKKDLTYTQNIIKYWGENYSTVVGPHTRVEFVKLNLDSHLQMVDHLLSCGWKPVNFTSHPTDPKPKIDEASMGNVPDGPLKRIIRYYVLKHRRGLLCNTKDDEKGLMNLVREDGRISARVVSTGTNTGRMRHVGVANIPKADPNVVYGKEFRELFTVPEGYKMVGIDAKALEARMEAHYTYPFDNGAYAEELMQGDVHTKNALAFNSTRTKAKNGKYCLTYGGAAKKLALTLGCSNKEAKVFWDNFWEANPALKMFKDAVLKEYQKYGGKFIVGIDGRKLFSRAEHSLVNLKFQSAGSICIKVAILICFTKLMSYNILQYCKLIITMHDEWQAEVKEEYVEQYTQIALKSIEDAGKYFKLNIPLEGDVKVGMSWAETH